MNELLTQQQVKSLDDTDFAVIFGEAVKFKTKPRAHQYASILWAMDRECGLFLHDIGTGKTLSALYTVQVWKCKKILIICPNSVRKTWMDQIEEHTDETYTVLEGEAKKRCMLMEESRTKYHIINYEGLKCLFAKKVAVQKKGEKLSSKYIPDHEKILRMEYDCVVWDECFPEDQLVSTERGLFTIGYIVETQMNTRVVSFNETTRKLEYKRILRYIKRQTASSLVEIKHTFGSIICTPSHKFYTDEGWKRADELCQDEALLFLRSVAYNQEGDCDYDNGTKSLHLLQEALYPPPPLTAVFLQCGMQRKNGRSTCFSSLSQLWKRVLWSAWTKALLKTLCKQSHGKLSFEEGDVYKLVEAKGEGWASTKCKGNIRTTALSRLQVLWKTFSIATFERLKDLLRTSLCHKMDNQSTSMGIFNDNRSQGETIKNTFGVAQTATRTGKATISSNENEQSHGKQSYCGENESNTSRQGQLGICCQRGASKGNTPTRKACSGVESSNGSSCSDQSCNGFATESSNQLFSGYCRCQDKSCHRSGWVNAPGEEAKVHRLPERDSFESVRVESVTVHESTSGSELPPSYQRNQTVYNLEIEDNHNYFVNGVLVSNCHHVGNHSLQADISYHLGRFARKRLMLTGTPISKDIRDFFQEFKILDDGACLGGSEFEFLHTYMSRVEIKTKTHKFFEWFPKKDASKMIIEKLAPSTIRYDISECCDLPELIMEARHVAMTAEQKSLLRAVVDKLKIEITTGKLNVKNVLDFSGVNNETIKLAQIGSGIVIEPGKTHILSASPKIDEAIDIIQSEVAGKVVIFHNFIEVGRIIEDRLRKIKIKFRSLRGEIKDKMKQIDDFRKIPDIKVMVAHPMSGGEGLNFQCANVAIFIDWIGVGSIIRDQCIGRIHRMGQDQPCVIIDLLLADADSRKETVDQKLYTSVNNKCDVSKAILDWIRDY